jgi:hypothetical protein
LNDEAGAFLGLDIRAPDLGVVLTELVAPQCPRDKLRMSTMVLAERMTVSIYRRLLLLPAVLAIVGAMVAPAYADETTGVVSGRITTSTGDPARWPQVMLLTRDGTGYREKLGEPDGTYEFADVRPGEYKLEVRYDGVRQFAHRKVEPAQADLFTVEAGKNTVIDEQMFEPGAIEVKVVDAKSGGPVETACVTLWYEAPETCTPENGVFRFTGLGRKSDYAIDVRAADGLHMPGQARNVAVELGETTRVTIELDPAAVITTKVLDRASGEPVEWACVAALPRYFQGIHNGYCPESTTEPTAESDGEGMVRIGEIPPGERRLFVTPHDGVHGIQWVGENGGTGSQYTALKIDAVAGKVSEVGPIRLDPAGSLSGRFVDASGGPLESTSFCATAMPQPEQGLAPGSNCGSSDGTFTIPNLGPYEWPVGFSDPWGSTYGIQWPGGTLDRKSADTHQVTSGTTRDIGTMEIEKGHMLSGQIRQPNEQPWLGTSFVSLFNARTGDFLGTSRWGPDYWLSPVTGQNVKLRVHAEGYGTYWYPSAPTFSGGEAVRISSTEDTRRDIVVPSSR